MAQGGTRAAALIVATLAAGCAAGGPMDPAPPLAPARIADGAVVGPDGTRLALTVWAPDGPARATILAVHGFGGYGQASFTDAAEYWAAQGVRTVAYDQRGFGRNSSNGRWPGPEALIGDLGAVAEALHAGEPCLPLTVVGHSMGGGVVLAAAGEGRLAAEQIVLAAPAIWGNGHLDPLYRVAAWLAAATVPEQRFTGEGVVEIQASDNFDYMRRMAEDPIHISRPSAREIMGLVRLMDRADTAAGQARLPAILLLGAKDEIVEEDDVKEVFATVPGAVGMVRYPEGWHLLFNDLHAEQVWGDVAELALDAPRRDGCGE